jgi:hypothetical protein
LKKPLDKSALIFMALPEGIMRIVAIIVAVPLYAFGVVLLGLGLLALTISAILCGQSDDDPPAREEASTPFFRRLRILMQQ